MTIAPHAAFEIVRAAIAHEAPASMRLATYYSLVGTAEAVLIVARWHDDHPTGATCWTELDREAHRDGEHAEAAWERLKSRWAHCLSNQ